MDKIGTAAGVVEGWGTFFVSLAAVPQAERVTIIVIRTTNSMIFFIRILLTPCIAYLVPGEFVPVR